VIAGRLHRVPLAAGWVVVVIAAALVAAGTAAAVFVHPLVGVAVVLGLAAAPLVLRSAGLAFLMVVAIIALVPFAAIPLGVGFNPTFLDVALCGLYLVVAVRVTVRDQPLRWPPLTAGVLVLAAVMVLALLAGSANGIPERNDLRRFGELLLAMGLFFVVPNLVANTADLRRVYVALIACGALAAAIGLALYLLPEPWQVSLLSLLRVVDYPSGSQVLRFINDDPARLQRATGTAIDPNSFGGMLAVVAALLVPQAVTRRPVLDRRLVLAFEAVLIAALLATVSRGSMLGLAVAIGVVGMARDRRLLLAVASAALVLVVAARVTPWTSSYVEHFAAGVRVEDRATQMRAGEYRDAVRLVERYPILGVGFGEPRDVDLYRGVSMLYLIVAETTGLLGLGCFLALMAAAAVLLAGAWRRLTESGTRAIVLGCLAALASALASGLVDHYFFTYPHAFALLWLVLGLGMAAIVTTRTEGAEPAPGSAPSSKEEEKMSSHLKPSNSPEAAKV
jgi:hypothetical protein